MILMDTDICIELLRGNKKVLNRREKENAPLSISFMTVGELFFGAFKSLKTEPNIILIEKLMLTVKVLNSDFEIMKKFGELKAQLINSGTILPDADILIAATTLCKCSKLVTGNTEHFKRFEELKLENWAR